MWNAGLDESQGGIKIANRSINNLIYAHDITLMGESQEKLFFLLNIISISSSLSLFS